MSRLATSFVLGYHGCEHSIGVRAVNGEIDLLHSRRNYDWLGPGAYFWESDPHRALEWAQERVKEGRYRRAAVVGAVIGEMSLLLGTRHSATVEASQPTRLRFVANGNALLDRDPAFAKLVAIGLAERLALLTTYLADLTQQHGDAPGLSMLSTVLGQLEQRAPDPDTTDTGFTPGDQAR